MTETHLAELVALGESDTLEFKKTTAEREAAMKTLCGMLNGNGGRVLIGVTEAGKIRGQMISDATLRELAQAYTQFEAPAAIRQMRVSLTSGQEVFVIEVEHNLTERQRRILFILRDGKPVRAEEIRMQLDPPMGARNLRHELKRLQEWGLIQKSGRGMNTVWMLV